MVDCERWEGVGGGGRDDQARVVGFRDRVDLCTDGHRRVQTTHLHPSRTIEMEKLIIRTLLSDARLFQPFQTRSDRVDTLIVRNGGHQYRTWPLWDEFSKSHSPPPGPPGYANGCIQDDVAPRATLR